MMRRWLCVVFMIFGTVLGDGSDWNEEGAAREFYNQPASLNWDNYYGDWKDRDGVYLGDSPFDSLVVQDTDEERWLEWNVTDLVISWLLNDFKNQGFLLRANEKEGGYGPNWLVRMYSKEGGGGTHSPSLILAQSDGQILTLNPTDDTYLAPSTYQPQGSKTDLEVKYDPNEPLHSLLRFSLPTSFDLVGGSAVLKLWVHQQYGGGSTTISVFRCVSGLQYPDMRESDSITWGFAADQFLLDSFYGGNSSTQNPDFIFFEDFESSSWQSNWSSLSGPQVEIVEPSQTVDGFSSFQGRALKMTIPQGSNLGLSLAYDFMDKIGDEPEEIYFRYYLRLASSWDQTAFGGKMPGISGTYGVAGWGGRQSHGDDGWSARGGYSTTLSSTNALGKVTPISNYVYHADMSDIYGDNFYWKKGCLGFLENNRWYSIETYCKMNIPGQNNGILRGWVDGKLAHESTNIKFRTVSDLRIERIWMNIYHGGTAVSPADQSAFIDNVVIARTYIGPMSETQVTLPQGSHITQAATSSKFFTFLLFPIGLILALCT